MLQWPTQGDEDDEEWCSSLPVKSSKEKPRSKKGKEEEEEEEEEKKENKNPLSLSPSAGWQQATKRGEHVAAIRATTSPRRAARIKPHGLIRGARAACPHAGTARCGAHVRAWRANRGPPRVRPRRSVDRARRAGPIGRRHVARWSTAPSCTRKAPKSSGCPFSLIRTPKNTTK